MKYCKDCANWIPKEGVELSSPDQTYSRCRAFIWITELDMIIGPRENYQYATLCRQEEARCGIEAKMFKQKEV